MSMLDRLGELVSVVHDVTAGVFVDIMGECSNDIVDMNIRGLMEGKMPDGEYIYPEYKAETAYYKRFVSNKYDVPSRPHSVPNLGDTGAFYGSIKLNVDEMNDEVYIDATDWKRDKLIKRYGMMLDIPDDYVENVAKEKMRDEMRERILNFIRS